jgi:hypothetical protein
MFSWDGLAQFLFYSEHPAQYGQNRMGLQRLRHIGRSLSKT